MRLLSPEVTETAAKTPVRSKDQPRNFEARLERLERENEKLQETVQALKKQPRSQEQAKQASYLESIGLGPTPTEATPQIGPPPFFLTSMMQPNVQDVGPGGSAAAPLKDETREFIVGANANLQARWSNLLMFESRDGAFVFHVGGREQFDPVWVDADHSVQTGKGATTPYLDGMGFRRARLQADATVYETIDMKAEFDFINTTTVSSKTFNVPVITDLWMQVRELPYIGNLRAGYVKPQIGLEHLTSSRFLEFMERSYNFDAFTSSENNGFQPGIYAFNWTEDLRATGSIGFFKTDQSIFAWSVGHGYNTSERVTWLPLWEDEGREYIHLGLSGGWGGTANGLDLIRARGLIRNGPAALQPVMAIANLQANLRARHERPEHLQQRRLAGLGKREQLAAVLMVRQVLQVALDPIPRFAQDSHPFVRPARQFAASELAPQDDMSDFVRQQRGEQVGCFAVEIDAPGNNPAGVGLDPRVTGKAGRYSGGICVRERAIVQAHITAGCPGRCGLREPFAINLRPRPLGNEGRTSSQFSIGMKYPKTTRLSDLPVVGTLGGLCPSSRAEPDAKQQRTKRDGAKAGFHVV